MPGTFVDVMLIDAATFSFFLKVNPGLVEKLGLAVALALPVMVLLWRAEPFPARRRTAFLGCLLSLAAPARRSLAVPSDREDEFFPPQYLSKFARSAALAARRTANGPRV